MRHEAELMFQSMLGLFSHTLVLTRRPAQLVALLSDHLNPPPLQQTHTQVRAAIGSFRGTKLLIVENCLASDLMTTTHTPRMLGDIHMLVQYGDAKERTEAQFAELLVASGFRLQRILATKSLFFVLEAVPV